MYRKILNELFRDKEFNINTVETINNNSPVLVSGMNDEFFSVFLLELFEITKQKQLIVLNSYARCYELYKQLNRFKKNSCILLENIDIKFYRVDAIDRKVEMEKIANLQKLYDQEYDFVIIQDTGLTRKYMPKKYYNERKFTLKVSQEIEMEDLISKLIDLGYEREDQVQAKGQFAHRGSIIDFFTPNKENPVRIEFFDNEIDSIRVFDADSQITIDKVQWVDVIHSREYLFPKDTEKIADKLQKYILNSTNDELAEEVEKIRNKVYFKGLDKYVSQMYDEKNLSIFSLLPKDIKIILDNPNELIENIENYYLEFTEDFKDSYARGFALKNQNKTIYTKDDVLKRINSYSLILNSIFVGTIKDFKVSKIINFDVKQGIKFTGDEESFINNVKYYLNQEYTIVVCYKNKEFYENTTKLFSDHYISFTKGKLGFLEKGLSFIRTEYSMGFVYENAKIVIISEKDFYTQSKSKYEKRKKLVKKSKKSKIDSFIDLKKGDYIVHETYGIGKFLGIEQRENADVTNDFLKVMYQGGDYLYIPISQMDKVQKYIGKDLETVKISKLGSDKWKKQKAKAKKAAESVAKYLVELYAQREKEVGYAFSQDTPWQREFEDLFPYDETTDQLKAIEDVKKDMQLPKPMDRLICGDVGYGKTEVAIRGIFKACMDGKQCAVLVPTTILAQQHYQTMVERFENYPINIQVVSRFKSKKQQDEIIRSVEEGAVDVLIGTHRLLSKDVYFKDLGLLVIDEEQRFGVKHKEKLKQMKKNIDVLTLTATPIPRTLNLSLSGIRDMSILEEPPEDRHPIVTYVTEARDGVILDAIGREIARDGQVFFVYNRVQSIEKIKAYIEKLIPGVSIAVAHGQMTSAKLEKIMMDYLEKKYQVLLCTTIIETGMDISNANTIIVYDADKMGLSQLYQLRGRVGRSKKQAYAYFLYEKDKTISEIAQKRLSTIKEFTEFGSGFKVAMRDLEIRGSGNLLGENQHGHIEEVGYDLYIKMLNEALRYLKKEEVKEEIITEVKLAVSAYFPDDYVVDEKVKIELYKKIASIKSKEDYYDVQEEIEDRFSDIPFEVENLLKVGYIKSLGNDLGIEQIYEKKGFIYFANKSDKISMKVANKSNKLLEVINFLEKIKSGQS